MRILKVIFLYLIIFQTINDNLMVDLFGPNILKFSLAAFIIINFNKFITFKYLKGDNKYVILFVLASVLSFFVNWDQYKDIQIPIIALIALLSYFIIFSQDKNIKQILIAITVSLVISSIYCILRSDTITEYTFRKTGGTGDPNEFSVMLLMGIGLVWGFYLDTKKGLLIAISLILLFTIALLYAGSKSAILALCLLVLTGTYFLYKYSTALKKIKRLSFVLLVLLSTYFFIDAYYGQIFNLFLERFQSSSSGEERFKSWNAGFEILQGNYIFGVGPLNYANMVANEFMGSIDEGSREAHNMFIKAFVETGVLGFIPFVVIMFKRLISIFKSNPLFTANLMYIGPFLMGLTLSLTFEKYFWLIIALLYNPFFNSIKKNEKGKNY